MAEGQTYEMRDPYQSGQDDGLLQETELLRKQVTHYRDDAFKARRALDELVLPAERRIIGHLDMAVNLAGQLLTEDGLFLDVSIFAQKAREMKDQILGGATLRALRTD